MEPFRTRKTGLIEMICGPMYSGKTEELIRRLRRAKIARQNVVVFKPSIDNRYDEIQVVSHSAQRIPSVPVENPAMMDNCFKQLTFSVDVVGIDEANFFDDSLIPIVEKWADAGVRVVIAGLDQDYLGKPFGPMPHLLAIADLVTKQYAVCVSCGSAATKTQRIQKGQQKVQPVGTVFVGGFDAYEARCRACHVRGVDEATVENIAPELSQSL